MGRAPCCDKMGLKKGPWTHQEDHILVDFIRRNGHGNWRALPKQAGLLRCGKSCRLRWINYLRPDIKRGNFSPEEEDAIIKLHQRLGNRWSAIASRLPGRTDNEIKNVWNTHLKKRLLRMGVDPVTHAVTKDSILPKTGDSLISLDYSEYIKEADASMEKNSFAASQEKVSLDYSEYSGPRSPLMEYENLAEAQFDYSDYNGATSPLMAEHNLTKAFLVDSPTRVSNFSDAFYDSQNLSTEIPSSLSSIESEVISGDSSSSSLDWLQSSCIDSFDEPIGYSPHPPAVEDERMFIFENQDFESEIRRFDVMLEQSSDENAEYLMSDNPEDDFLSGIDDEYTNTHLFKSIELSTKDDESDGISYWLNVLSHAGSSPMLL